MRITGKILTPVILLLFLFGAPSAADILSVKIRSKYRDIIQLSKFEFSQTGFISLAISSVAFSSLPVNSNLSPPDPSRVGVFLVSNELLQRFPLKWCPLDTNIISVLFTLQDLPPPSHSSFNKTYPMTYPGEYSLYFTNCNELSTVTMDVQADLYNTDHNNLKDYLPAELAQLPSLYMCFSIIYLCLLGFWMFWILICFKNREYFNRIHLLMGVFFIMAAVQYGCAAVVQKHVKVAGIRPHGWNALFYIFQFFRKVIFFTMMMELAWRPAEIVVLMIVFQVCANIVWKSGPEADVLSCALSILPISTLLTDDDSFKLGLAGETKLIRRSFIVVAVVYILTMMIDLAYPNRWVINVGKETCSLVFCMVMFYMFRKLFDIIEDQVEEIVEVDELRPLVDVDDDDQDEDTVELDEIRPLFSVDDHDKLHN